MGEKFAANPVTGTGSMSIPIATSPGRSGFGPSLSLSYDTGNGNGPFGFGWSLSLPAITRKTDKALPRYLDAEESDVFVMSGAEDLVPVLEADGSRYEDDTSAAGYVIHRYRPRVEGLFARIERWTRDDGDVHWRSFTRENVLTLYGKDLDSRIADPDDSGRIFSWLICETRDDKGNAVVYDYRREDGAGVDLGQPQERNRGDANDVRRTANRYLKRIRYGNRTSLLNNAGKRPRFLTPAQVENADWMFEVVLDYDEGHYEEVDPDPSLAPDEQHRFSRASPEPARAWPVRPDPTASHRACFEILAYRRCRRILMFHHIPDLPTGETGYDGLVRAAELDYADLDYSQPVAIEDELVHQGSTRFGSFLRAVTQCGYARDDRQPVVVDNGVEYATYFKETLPPLEFEYSKAEIQEDVLELDPESLENLPVGIDGSTYRWVDLDGEGISGVLTEQGGGWFYKPNLGDGQLGPLETLRDQPATAGLQSGRHQLLDLAGDGQLDLVALDRAAPGFYERTDGGWASFRAFRSLPNLDWTDPNLRLVDLAGGGHSDVLVAEQDSFTWYASLAEEGFGPASTVRHALDDERSPRLVFANGTRSVYLADMCGDGLADIVRVRNGEVCYWPNLGYGRFGPKVTMDNAPWFDTPDQFDQRRLRLADIDGSGTNDIVYVGRERVQLYFNQSGNRISEARPLPQLPHLDDQSSLLTVDLLANGTACLVWSSALPADEGRPLRYVDLMGGTKPHLLTRCVNNLGTETEIHYASSTRFSLADSKAGRPWVTRLPFPAHVVERLVVTDRISGNRLVTRHAYHHGFFDGVEREFRGFGLVEQLDTETFAALGPVATDGDLSSDVPPVLVKTWFHTGVYEDASEVSRYFAAEYYGAPEDDDPNYDAAFAAFSQTLLPDTILPPGLTVGEERESCRALKGSMLRQEVYALDGSEKEKHPYTVTEQNFTIRALQPRHANRHAVFFVHPRESIGYHHEREPGDPRVVHTLTLDADAFGNVLAAATIGYGRRQPDATLAAADQAKQARRILTYTENGVTEDHDTGEDAIDGDLDYRTPITCESRTYELTGLTLPAGRDRFYFSEVRDAGTTAIALDYEQAPTSGQLEKRLIEHVRTYFRRDDLAGALPLGHLQPLALPFESYKLAFTSGLVTQVFGGRVSDTMLGDEGRYVHTEGDTSWWVPSGRLFYSPVPAHSPAQELAYARLHFFLPHRHRNPFHTNAVSTESSAEYDRYDLLVHETTDALGNRVTVGERHRVLPDGTVLPETRRYDYRVLQPELVMDPNRNCTEVRFGALGLVVGTAVMGKPEESPRPGDRLATFRADLTQSEIDQFLSAPKGPTAITLLNDATTRVVYDVTAYWREPDPAQKPPPVAATLARETHASEPAADDPRIQVTIAYSDGFGRAIQSKVQAERGRVPVRDANGEIVLGADGSPQLTPNDVSPRWVGSGWTVFNSKGKPVRQYEPFFTDRHRFEFDVAIGASPVLFYDPPGRVVATLHPDHTWEKIVVGAWRQETWDANDTVSVDPLTDPQVSDFFSRLAGSDYLPTWDELRLDAANSAAFALRFPDPGDRAAEVRAAEKALVHTATPTVAHADPLGRTFLTVVHNAFKYSNAPPAAPRVEELHRMRVDLDVEGNRRRLRDAVTTTVDALGTATVDELGRVITLYDYDLLGSRIHEASMEAGERWMLNDVAGKPLYAWDSIGHRFRTAYDRLRRPTDSFLRVGAGVERTIGRSVYGESGLDPESSNSRGRVVEIRDQAGVVTTDDYDFKGNLLRRGRRLAQSYKTTLDWSSGVPLELETYTSRTRYDALNRPIQVVPPHSDQPGTGINVIQPSYNDANLLERVHVWLDESAEPAGRLDPASASLAAVTNIEYDAKGRRTRLDRGAPGGKVVRTSYAYDRETFRLTHLYTRRGVDPGTAAGVAFTDDCETLQPSPATIAAPEAPPVGGSCGLQNLRYTYDAAGNITRLRDEAQQTIFFRNKRVEPSAEYTYDALYRLIEATGREHLGQVGGPPIPHSYNDAPRAALLHPGDGNVMGTYLERYVYDAAGNFLSWQHHGTDPANPGWNRVYDYHEPSDLEPAKQSNRLTSTTIGSATEVHSAAGNGYDAHGRMLRMPQLSVMQWSFTGQLQMTQRQAVNASDLDGVQRSGERTWYVYDSAGERVRKVTERAGGPVKDERLYLGGFEIYRRNGGAPLVRETLHVVDDHQHLALVETRVAGAEPGVPARVIRHQFGNHLGSASLELDGQAQIVSYEEYTPYGSTSYQAVRNNVEAKRYRYTGRERDEESGLYHNGARYHAPWLGRWTSADPAGGEADPNLYRYCRNAPVMLKDPGGMDPPGAATPPYRLTPLLPDVNLTGMTGELQFHDVFSPDRSVSGRLGLSGTGRSAFILDVPGLHLNTTGLADLSGTAALDTSLGRGGLTLRGGLLLGDLSGLHLVVTGAGVFRIPVPDRIPLGGLPGSLLATIPQGEGEVNLTGALEAGSFSLATFRASASLAEGRFQGRLDATTVANLGRLRLDAAGTVSPEGDVSLESARLSANVGVPGFNLTLQGTGTATTRGNLALSANADLRLFGLPSLHAEGTGTASTSGADLSGRFYGPGPLYTSYITGNFSLSTRTGISADAAVFGLTYTPGVSVSSPVPDPPGLSVAAGGGPASPWTPEGLTLGVSYFRYQQGLFSHISGGFMPDLSQRIFTNPRVGVTAQWHF